MLTSLTGEIQFCKNYLDTQVTSPLEKDNIGLVCTEPLSIRTAGMPALTSCPHFCYAV